MDIVHRAGKGYYVGLERAAEAAMEGPSPGESPLPPLSAGAAFFRSGGRRSLRWPFPSRLLTRKFGSLYWDMDHWGSVRPRGEPATDGGSAAALPVSGGGGCLWGGERSRRNERVRACKRALSRWRSRLSQTFDWLSRLRVVVLSAPPLATEGAPLPLRAPAHPPRTRSEGMGP